LFIITALTVIIVFGLVIFIHELGHFLTAKAFKVKVHEFALGMGPCIFKKKQGETQYSLRAFPVGGYVKMEGEDEESEDENAFNRKKPYQRLIILAAGAIMNFILGFVLLMLFVGLNSDYYISSTVVSDVIEEYHADDAGIKQGDKIIEIDGSKINTKIDMSLALENKENVEVTVIRDKKKQSFNVKTTDVGGIKTLGVYVETLDKNFINILKHSYHQTFTIIKMTYKTFFDMFKGKVGVEQMSGPVGIVTEIGNAAQRSLFDVLWLLIIITLNLGVVNLFPLPALDGGRIIFVLYEMITRKKLKPETEGIIHFIGFAILILFMLYITKNDIVRLFKG